MVFEIHNYISPDNAAANQEDESINAILYFITPQVIPREKEVNIAVNQEDVESSVNECERCSLVYAILGQVGKKYDEEYANPDKILQLRDTRLPL